MRLSELEIGETRKIKNLPQNDPLSKRLSEMGYYNNISVTAILSNQELCMFQIGDTLIALKKSESSQIELI